METQLDMVVNLPAALVSEAARASLPSPTDHRFVRCVVIETRRQGASAA